MFRREAVPSKIKTRSTFALRANLALRNQLGNLTLRRAPSRLGCWVSSSASVKPWLVVAMLVNKAVVEEMADLAQF